jgi:membrane-bound ClpP family serine protease
LHAWLAFLIGIFTTLGAFLFFAAFSGIQYYGLAVQVEVAIAIGLLVVAAIVTYIFYVGIKAQYTHVQTGLEALIGSNGLATSDIKPRGEVRVLGEFWQAKTKDCEINTGQQVEVVGIEGMFLIVKPVENQEEKLDSPECKEKT